jgi:adenylyl-sulfate kinase
MRSTPVGRRKQTRLNRGFVLWLTGLSSAGKTTIADLVVPELERRGFVVEHLDGDVVRTHLSVGLGFSEEDRKTNISRIGWVASRVARAGAAVVVSAISPYEEGRQRVKRLVERDARFVEAYVSTPLSVCAARDPKGLYAKALSGEIAEFTGVSAPYEEPSDPDIRVETTHETPHESARFVLTHLERMGLIGAAP